MYYLILDQFAHIDFISPEHGRVFLGDAKPGQIVCSGDMAAVRAAYSAYRAAGYKVKLQGFTC